MADDKPADEHLRDARRHLKAAHEHPEEDTGVTYVPVRSSKPDSDPPAKLSGAPKAVVAVVTAIREPVQLGALVAILIFAYLAGRGRWW